MTLFDSRHLLYQLLWNMFSKEVELADSMQTLFRGNSLASKIMTFCFKVGLSSLALNGRPAGNRCCPDGLAAPFYFRSMGRPTCRSSWSLY